MAAKIRCRSEACCLGIDQPNGVDSAVRVKMFSKDAVHPPSSWFGPRQQASDLHRILAAMTGISIFTGVLLGREVTAATQLSCRRPNTARCTARVTRRPPRTSAQVVLPAGELQYSTHWSKA